MTNINKLNEELDNIDERLAQLQLQRGNILTKIKTATNENTIEEFNKMCISDNSCLVLLARDAINEYYMIRTLLIQSIEPSRMFINCVEGCYSNGFEEVCFRIDPECKSYASFLEYKDNYEIYILEHYQFNEFLQELCELKVTRENLQKYRDHLVKSNINIIS